MQQEDPPLDFTRCRPRQTPQRCGGKDTEEPVLDEQKWTDVTSSTVDTHSIVLRTALPHGGFIRLPESSYLTDLLGEQTWLTPSSVVQQQ